MWLFAPTRRTVVVACFLTTLTLLVYTVVARRRTHQVSVAAELQTIAERLDASDNEFVGRQSLLALEDRLAHAPLRGMEKVALDYQHVNELLRFGENQRAWSTTEGLVSLFAKNGAPQPPELLRLRAMVNLRLAEQQNCVSGACEQSCIFPIERGGVHRRREPAERARAALTEYLALNPADALDARWLLNIVNMTLGEYPDAVPEDYRIAPDCFEAEYEVGRFTDAAVAAGVKAVNLAGGVVADDFNGDGLLDIFTTTMAPRGPAQLFRNRGDGNFENVSRRAGIEEQLGGLNCVGADYDNDGDTDLMILRGGWIGGPNGRMRLSLLRNNGDLTFTDVTHEAGMAEPAYPRHSAAWGDFDNDGDLDVYIGSESIDAIGVDGAPAETYPSQLFRNNGDGTFTDIAAEAGVENNRYAKGVAAGDYDNDGDLDLYVSNYSFLPQFGGNRLYRNNGDLTFTDVAGDLRVRGGKHTFGTWFFDYDNDGWLDLFVCSNDAQVSDVAADYLGQPHRATPPFLYKNEHGRGFVDRASAAGLQRAWSPMGCGIGDLDNDGYLDIYLGTGAPSYESLMPNVLLRNDAGRRFQDVTFSARVGHLQKGHGVAFADFDNDGDQDIFAQLGGALPGDVFGDALFLNPGHGHRFLKVEVVGTRSNRSGVGARLAVEFEEDGELRTIHRSVGAITSFGSLPSRLELGLGHAARIHRLSIDWPTTGQRQTFDEVPLDACVRVVESEPQLDVRKLPSFQFPLPDAATH